MKHKRAVFATKKKKDFSFKLFFLSMSEVDPETLLEWLQSGAGEERDMQLIALEQLCMLLLMSDNVDRCFESCPPRTFLPALCRIFLDCEAPDQVQYGTWQYGTVPYMTGRYSTLWYCMIMYLTVQYSTVQYSFI